jgi:hypothetical protein
VEVLRRAPVVREEDQAEPDLRHQQRLGRGEQMRDDATRLAAAVVRPAGECGRTEGRSEHEECDDVMGR